MHPALAHHLRTLGIDPALPPEQAEWSRLIQMMDGLLRETDRERAFLVQLIRAANEEFTARESDLVETVRALQQQDAERAHALTSALQGVESATRAKTTFLANMSHEIRTPMTAILGYSDLLLDPAQSATDRSACIQTIRRNGEHLLGVINDILDLSKIEDGRISVERSEVDVFRVMEEVRSTMQVRAQDKAISLRTEVCLPFPANISTDQIRLQQILLNLVGNAIKFTDSGGVCVRASLLQDGTRNLARFEVTDTGIGMTAEQIGRLYQPFTQVDSSSTRAFGGTGLGLTISKKLAVLMGGDIDVTSTMGVGTTFALIVDAGALRDVAMLRQEPGRSVQRQQVAGSVGSELRNCRVLLAEDGPDNQRLFAHHLRRAGAELVIVENGLLAVERVMEAARMERPFDIILMDMQMPELDGYGATSQLRSRGYSGPIIALTAHALLSDRDRCMTAGCTDYITKPVEREMLIQTCVRWHAAQVAQTADIRESA